VEALTRRQGSDLLYFDDRPENIATARARGWQAHIHTDPAGSIAQVRAAGLLG
jgi:2-haloacid dehalogenase